jgi:hypothetical protein
MDSQSDRKQLLRNLQRSLLRLDQQRIRASVVVLAW